MRRTTSQISRFGAIRGTWLISLRTRRTPLQHDYGRITWKLESHDEDEIESRNGYGTRATRTTTRKIEIEVHTDAEDTLA